MEEKKIDTNKIQSRMTHTIEQVNELKAWFDEHAHELPKEMQINRSAFTPDLKQTVEYLFTQAYICCENYKMQGCILLLKEIKKNMEEGQNS